jgi:acetyl esterase/lipase
MLLKAVQCLARYSFRNLPEAGSPETDILEALTPAQAKVVALAEKSTPLHKFSPSFVRRAYRWMEQPFNVDRQAMASVSHVNAIMADGHACRLRVYTPKTLTANGPHPAMVYYHGGGCVIGDLESHDIFCRFIAHESNLIVVAVDYRCSPEYRFPIPLTDSIEAYNWVVDHAEEMGIDPQRLGVGGDSAGGYMATTLCQQYMTSTLDVAPNSLPAFQWLIYPMVDIRGGSDSYRNADSGMLLTRHLMDYFSGHFISGPEDLELVAVNPILAEELSGLPPTYLVSVGHDPLRDDDITYAEKLSAQGVNVEHQHYPNMMHGFISMGGICPQALQALDHSFTFLRENTSVS